MVFDNIRNIMVRGTTSSDNCYCIDSSHSIPCNKINLNIEKL